jgi:hypothetical protein
MKAGSKQSIGRQGISGYTGSRQEMEEQTSVPIGRSTCHLFHAGIFLGLFFDPEDGGDMFLRNFG